MCRQMTLWSTVHSYCVTVVEDGLTNFVPELMYKNNPLQVWCDGAPLWSMLFRLYHSGLLITVYFID